MIRKTYTLTLPHAAAFTDGWCVVDIITEGRFWRTSRLLGACAITYGTPCTERCWIAEREEDEYDILAELSQVLKTAGHLMTFNGTGFDLPHLQKKYQAYRADDPTAGRGHLDLMHALKPYRHLFGLQSYHLKDYLSLFRERYEIKNDAEGALLVSALLDLSGVFADPAGEPEAQLKDPDSPGTATEDAAADGVLGIKWRLPSHAPVDLDLTDEVFHMEVRAESVCLEAAVAGGMLRRYYTDYMNYDFLLAEGCAVHRSLTTYVAADRKTKAVRENCYSLIPLSSVYPARPDRLRKYVVSALAYLRRDIPCGADAQSPVPGGSGN